MTARVAHRPRVPLAAPPLGCRVIGADELPGVDTPDPGDGGLLRLDAVNGRLLYYHEVRRNGRVIVRCRIAGEAERGDDRTAPSPWCLPTQPAVGDGAAGMVVAIDRPRALGGR